jgi:hypothetical protein
VTFGLLLSLQNYFYMDGIHEQSLFQHVTCMLNFRRGNETKASNTEAVPWGYKPTSRLAHKPWAHFTAAAEFN